jgi:hypothetical protein
MLWPCLQGKYAVALYKIVVDGVNEHWPHRPDDQAFVIRKLIAVIDGWESACREWRREATEAVQLLQHAAARTQQFGDPNAPSYAEELQRITHEIAQLSESLQQIWEFEEAWRRGRVQILAALQDAQQRHETSKASQPPARQKGSRRRGQGKRHRPVRA